VFSSRLFWKLFGVYSLLSAVAAFSIVTILGHRQREIIFDQEHRRLHDSAATVLNLLDEAFTNVPDGALEGSIRAIAAENETRITLIRVDGTVVVDSERDPLTMENHGDRVEVLQAKTSGIGSARRASPTLGIEMLYLAMRAGDASSPAGYVRVSVPLDSVEAEVFSVQRLVLVTSVVVSLILLVPMFYMLSRITQPLTSLTGAANAIAGGDLNQTVDVPGGDELGTLGEAFNTMSRELSARMSDLNQTSQELRGSTQLLSTVFGSMIEGVIAVDNEERILFANRAARVLLDFGNRDPIGRPIWECVRNETVQTVVRQAMNGLKQSVECDLPRSESVVEIRSTPLSSTPLAGDARNGVVLVMHDVTELRRLGNLRREFVSNVSHELKTPLTIIQTATETLLDGALEDGEHSKRFLNRINEQGTRLHELIVDLLQLAQVESGGQVFELTTVSVRSVVDSVVDEFSALAFSGNVGLIVEPASEELLVQADGSALRTIIENLLTNALKYTPAGGQVTVAWAREQRHAMISVRDTGVGIPHEHHSRIFERFYVAVQF
jgi:two-component system, OmpR family, phosphate regulon sensor histidine kinase PhoR